MIDFFKMFGRIQASGSFFGEQYIYVVADLATLIEPKYKKRDAIYFPDQFLASLINTQKIGKEQAIVWGGSSKGVIFSLLRERIGKPVNAVVDINTVKQGRFLPVTGLEVLSPETVLNQFPGNSSIYVMNSNYIDEIKEMSSYQFTNYIGVDQ